MGWIKASEEKDNKVRDLVKGEKCPVCSKGDLNYIHRTNPVVYKAKFSCGHVSYVDIQYRDGNPERFFFSGEVK